VVIQQVFAKEEMRLTNEDVTREILLMAEEYEVTPEEMVKMLQESKAFDEVQFRVVQRKVRELLYENAEFAEAA